MRTKVSIDGLHTVYIVSRSRTIAEKYAAESSFKNPVYASSLDELRGIRMEALVFVINHWSDSEFYREDCERDKARFSNIHFVDMTGQVRQALRR